MLKQSLRDRVFGEGKKPPLITKDALSKAKELLAKFDISVPVNSTSQLYDGDLPLPELLGDDIRQHFELAAKEFIGDQVDLIDQYVKTKELPPFDINKLVYRRGWTRYEWINNDWVSQSVQTPTEKLFIFDCETFVKGGSYPVIGTAISDKALYVWLAKEIIEKNLFNRDEWDQFGLIDVGEDNVIIGHNVSYDRIRSKRAYDLTKQPDNYWLDTMSMHISSSGLASGQRYIYTVKEKVKRTPEKVTEKEMLISNVNPSWYHYGSTNSLVECYNHHVVGGSFFKDELTITDKKTRDLFVSANTMNDLQADKTKLIDYAIKDVYYTAELAKAVWPKYRRATPSYVSYAGHVYLLTSKIPLVDNWEEWIGDCESIYQEQLGEISTIVNDIVRDLMVKWSDLFKQDLDTLEGLFIDQGYELFLKATDRSVVDSFLLGKSTFNSYFYTPKGNFRKFKPFPVNKLVEIADKLHINWYVKTKTLFEDDLWYSQLDWSPCYYKSKWCPMWFLPWAKDPDYKATNKTNITHLLLKLTWEGKPVYLSESEGWCFIDCEEE